jgi:circadian clock protein KaiB
MPQLLSRIAPTVEGFASRGTSAANRTDVGLVRKMRSSGVTKLVRDARSRTPSQACATETAARLRSARRRLDPTWQLARNQMTAGDEQPRGGPLATYLLKLYVTGTSPRAEVAIANLRRICEQELHGQYELEIIDVLEHPQLAEDEKILATPTLIKQLPPPLRRVIGDLSDKEKVLLGLEVRRDASNSAPQRDVS